MDSKDFLMYLSNMREERQLLNIEDKVRYQIQAFVQLFLNKVIPESKRADVQKYLYLLDIDRDGFIDQFDLDTFLNRHIFIEEHLELDAAAQQKTQPSSQAEKKESEPNSNANKLLKLSSTQRMPLTFSQELFPTRSISDDKLQIILDNFKFVLRQKKLSFEEAFKQINTSNIGFITAAEFDQGISKFIRLSNIAKEGVFSYLDNLKIGMFDLPRFIEVMSRLTLMKSSVPVDNFDWQYSVIEKIRKWFQSSSNASAPAGSQGTHGALLRPGSSLSPRLGLLRPTRPLQFEQATRTNI